MANESDPAPQILYHYTTPAGLLGIVQSKALWVTHFRHLNDRSEYTFALKKAAEMIKAVADERKDDKFLASWLVATDDARKANVFVCSFSVADNGDQLGQWRAYASVESGYSIGFSRADLLKSAESQPGDFQLAECVYDREKRAKRLNSILAKEWEEAVRVNRTAIANFAHLIAKARLSSTLAKTAPAIKHDAFREEQEWRLFAIDFKGQIHFRTTQSGIIPYCCFDLSTVRNQAIAEVTVGPGPDQDQARHAAETLLATHGIDAPVKSSSIPYRHKR